MSSPGVKLCIIITITIYFPISYQAVDEQQGSVHVPAARVVLVALLHAAQPRIQPRCRVSTLPLHLPLPLELPLVLLYPDTGGETQQMMAGRRPHTATATARGIVSDSSSGGGGGAYHTVSPAPHTHTTHTVSSGRGWSRQERMVR